MRNSEVSVAKAAGAGVQRTIGNETRKATGVRHQGLQPMSGTGASNLRAVERQ